MLMRLEEILPEVDDLVTELDRRGNLHRKLEDYYTGNAPLPRSIVQAQVTQAYRMLMAFAQTNYGKLIVKAATSRMEIGGIRSGDEAADNAAWGVWQANRMDSESRRGHDAALTHGRVFAIVWPDDEAPESEITLEDSATCIVAYKEGSRYERTAGLRRWIDTDKVPHATLYTPDYVYKLSGPKDEAGGRGTKWQQRIVPDEPWPLPTPGSIVPVVEIATNRRLRSSRFGHAAGDFEAAVGLMDRINVLEFLRLVIAFTSGFPIRAVIGDKILRDDDDNPIAPFKLAADIIAQFENPETKIVEIKASDLKGFGDAIDHDVETLAGITQTPAYYMRSIPIQNVSADAIRASDSPLNARVEDHKPDIGEGWEEVLRVASIQAGGPELSDRAEIVWVNRESRSLAERADAATKLAAAGLPWQAVFELALDATQDQITRWEAMQGSSTLGGLLNQPPAKP